MLLNKLSGLITGTELGKANFNSLDKPKLREALMLTISCISL